MIRCAWTACSQRAAERLSTRYQCTSLATVDSAEHTRTEASQCKEPFTKAADFKLHKHEHWEAKTRQPWSKKGQWVKGFTVPEQKKKRMFVQGWRGRYDKWQDSFAAYISELLPQYVFVFFQYLLNGIRGVRRKCNKNSDHRNRAQIIRAWKYKSLDTIWPVFWGKM